MSKFIYTLLFFLIAPSIFSNEWEDLLFSKSIDWKSVDIDIPLAEEEQLLESAFQMELFKSISDTNLVPKSNFHFLHLDSDHLIDLIYCGYTGSEAVKTLFLKNKGDGFELILDLFGEIQNYRKRDHLIQFKLVNYPCCDGYITHIDEYIFNVQNAKIELIKNIAFLEGSRIPESLPMNKNFETSKALNRLRSDPSLNNHLYDKGSRLFDAVGNIIAEFEKGTSGVALAETFNSAGHVMYFVVISKDAKINQSLFYAGANNNESFDYVGWMSAHFITFKKSLKN